MTTDLEAILHAFCESDHCRDGETYHADHANGTWTVTEERTGRQWVDEMTEDTDDRGVVLGIMFVPVDAKTVPKGWDAIEAGAEAESVTN